MKKTVALSLIVSGVLSMSQIAVATELNENSFFENSISVNDEETVTLKITGMTCGGCASHVSTALTELEGVISEDVSYPGDRNTITYNPKKTSVEKIIAAIEKTGYKAEIITEKDKTEKG